MHIAAGTAQKSLRTEQDLNDAKHWRDRAAEMRVLAENLTDATAVRLMAELARADDKLADRVAERAKGDGLFPPKPSPLSRP